MMADKVIDAEDQNVAQRRLPPIIRWWRADCRSSQAAIDIFCTKYVFYVVEHMITPTQLRTAFTPIALNSLCATAMITAS
jgi:hypothetical protein